MSMRLLCSMAITIVAVGVFPVAHGTTPAEMKAALESTFTVTTRNVMGSVKAPGTVLVVQKEGIRAGKPSLFMRPATIKDGQLTSVGGGGVILGGNTGVILKVGDRVQLYSVKNTTNSVGLIIATVETFQVAENGSTKSMPYEAGVGFQYDSGLESVSIDTVMKDIGAWFKTEAESTKASTKTIALGQTPEQVLEILGPPEKKIELGAKVIYVYKDLKVIFVGDKVSDVQ